MLKQDYSRVVWGVVVIAFGLLLLADQRSEWDFSFSGQFWPFILIALGAARLIQAPDPDAGRPRRAGGFLLFVGLWALATELQIAGLEWHNSWPIVVVGVGVSMVWRSFRGDPICGRHPARRNHAA